MKKHGNTLSYTIGFILSLAFTIVAYLMVVQHWASSDVLLVSIITLAFLQLLVQLVFFLHLGRAPQARWNLVFFVTTFGIVLYVVVGSVWIMHHLNKNMTPEQMEQNLIKGEGIPAYLK